MSTSTASTTTASAMATPPARPPRTESANLSTKVGFINIYAIVAILAIVILYKIPSFFKHTFTSNHGRYGYSLKRSKEKNTPIVPIGPAEDTGTVYGSSGIKSIGWGIRKILMVPIPLTGGLSVGKVLIVIIYLAVTLAFTYFKNADPKTGLDITNFQRLGHIAVAQLPFAFALGMKNSPLGYLIGEGYEKLNFLHRAAGRLVFLFAAGHWGIVFKGQYAKKAVKILPAPFIYGYIALVTLLLMSLTGSRVIRSHFYQFFLWVHVLGYIIVLVALYMHTPGNRPYVYASLIIIVLDRLLQMVKTRFATATITAMPGGLTKIAVLGVSDGWRAGQHVYMRVLNGRNILEKHPFTIANAPTHAAVHKNDQELVLYIKATGNFTRRVYNMAGCNDVEHSEKSQAPSFPQTQVRVAVEGPYGAFFENFAEYDTVFLCAGGSGFSYAMGVLEEVVGKALRGDVISTRHIDLIWVFRDMHYVEAYADSIAEVVNAAAEHLQLLTIRIRLYMAAGGSIANNPLEALGANLQQGRPVLSSLLADTVVRSNSLAVGVCGPTSLVHAVQSAARGVDVSTLSKIAVHSEHFGW